MNPFSKDYKPTVDLSDVSESNAKSRRATKAVERAGLTALPIKNIHASIGTKDEFKGAKIQRGGI